MTLRLLFFLLAVVFHYRLKRVEEYGSLVKWITAYTVISPAIYLFLIYHHGDPVFFIRCLSIILIIHVIFMLPNRWLNNLIISCLLALSFFVLMYFRYPEVPIAELRAAFLYSIVFIMFTSMSSYRLHYYKRMQFLKNKELESIATRDTLTGIFNRLKFNEELDKWLHYSKRYKTALSLIMFDFDDFKQVNDTFGHLAGDRVISGVAALVQDNIRDTDVFARWGGEEFVILMPNTGGNDARKLAFRLQNAIENLVFPEAGKITCSFGVVSLREEDTADTLLIRADQLLYTAKQKGKNIVVS
ncbi:MAG TPA: GGDEF domain-containing protein [Firmicutes bacterium]|nr:GGDEF domain-containing protein [Bacillota bacterium]